MAHLKLFPKPQPASVLGVASRRGTQHGPPASSTSPQPPSRFWDLKRTWRAKRPFRSPSEGRYSSAPNMPLCGHLQKWRDSESNRGHHDFQGRVIGAGKTRKVLHIDESRIPRPLRRYPWIPVVPHRLRTWRARHVLFACHVRTAARGTKRAWLRVRHRLLLLLLSGPAGCPAQVAQPDRGPRGRADDPPGGGCLRATQAAALSTEAGLAPSDLRW